MPNFNPGMAFWQGRDDAQRNQLDIQQNQRRNALADIVQQREATQFQQVQDDRQQEQKLRSTLALIAQADGAPPEVQAQVLATISQQDPDFGRVFGQMPPGEAIRRAGDGIRTKLGMPVQSAQTQANEQYTLSPGAARYDSSGRVIAERGFAPPRDIRETVNGVPGIYRNGKWTPLSTLQSEIDAAEAAAAAKARGAAAGDAAGNRGAKEGPQRSLDYVVQQFSDILNVTPSGGPMGVKGKVGYLTDYQEARRFDNLREQLSTELRTMFRIPGEGTLSDREQAQYGIQLPSRDMDPTNNAKILNDIQQRVRLRQNTGASAPTQPNRIKFDATGKRIP